MIPTFSFLLLRLDPTWFLNFVFLFIDMINIQHS